MFSISKLLATALLCLCISHVEAEWRYTGKISPYHSGVSNAVDGAGNATAVWAEFYSKTNHIYSSDFFKGNKYWEIPSAVFGENNRDFTDTGVVVDSAGNAVAIWQENDGALSKVRSSSRPFKGQWSPPVDISGTTDRKDMTPRIAITASGYAVAVWNLDYTIQAATLEFGGKWSTPVTLATQDGDAPTVGIANNGTAIALWQKGAAIQSASLPLGGNWSTPVTLSKKNSMRGQLAVNPAGQAIATWWTYGASKSSLYSIHAAILESENTWSRPTLIATADYIMDSTVTIASSGDILVVWVEEDIDDSQVFPIPSDPFIQASRFSSGYWSRPVTLSSKKEKAFNPCVKFDESSNAFVVWNDYSTIQAARIHKQNGIWTAPETIATIPAGLISRPQICVDHDGVAIVNWSTEGGEIHSALWTSVPIDE